MKRNGKDAGMEARPEDVFRSLRGRLQGAYPALVTATACALLVLLLWPATPRTYVAETLAVASRSAEATPATEDALQWLGSESVWQAAFAKLRREQPQALTAIEAGPVAGDAMAALHSRLQLARVSGPDELPRLAIAWEGSSRRTALLVAEAVGRQLSERYAAQRQRERLADFQQRERLASVELNEARAAQERMEIQLEGLRHAQITSAVASAAAANGPPAAAAASEPASQLAQKIGALKVERDRLLEIYLPAHPQVQTISAQISRLEDSLRRYAERKTGGWDETSADEAPANGSKVLLQWRRQASSNLALASGQETTPPPDRGSELVAAIRKLQIDLLAATQRRKEAEQNWHKLAEERQPSERSGIVDWSLEPARIVSVSGAAQARSQLAAALLAATLGALIVAWLARLAARDRMLATVAELRSSVALPVLGSLLSGDDEPDVAPAPKRTQQVLNVVTRGSEVVLLTFALTLLAAAALDGGVLTDLIHDPLPTLGELVERLI